MVLKQLSVIVINTIITGIQIHLMESCVWPALLQRCVSRIMFPYNSFLARGSPSHSDRHLSNSEIKVSIFSICTRLILFRQIPSQTPFSPSKYLPKGHIKVAFTSALCKLVQLAMGILTSTTCKCNLLVFLLPKKARFPISLCQR